jgi:hypothetical protein
MSQTYGTETGMRTDDRSLRRDLFAMIDGLPAHILVVLGLTLTLLSPILPRSKAAAAADAMAEAKLADELVEMDLETTRKSLAKEDKADEEKLAKDPAIAPDVEKRREARAVVLKDLPETLHAKYKVDKLRRDAVEARASAAGPTFYLYLHWIGRVLLIVGLLVLTLMSDGIRQKIFLVVLLVALFSSLTGVKLDFNTSGSIGSSGDVPWAPN